MPPTLFSGTQEPLILDVYILNPITFVEQFYCSIPIIGNANGWAGEAPCRTPDPCEIIIDLDGDDSSGLFPLDFRDSVYCRPSEILVSDIDASVQSGKPWDSLHVFIMAPTGTNASLTSIPVMGTWVNGSGTNVLRVYNDGSASPDDLALLITEIKLIPDVSFFNTTYTIGVVGYAADLVSDTAFSFLYAGDLFLTAGEDGEIMFCRDGLEYDLSLFLADDASPGGYWSGAGMPSDGRIQSLSFTSGTYYYIVVDPTCGPDTSVWDISIAELPVVDLGGDTLICDDQPLTLVAPLGYVIRWHDGSIGATFEAMSTGYYWLEATSSDGCTFRDSIFIEFAGDIVLDTVLFLCQGEELVFHNTSYTQPGFYDQFLPGASGLCDTLWIIEVVYVSLMDLDIQIQGTLCNQGQVILIGPEIAEGLYHWSTGGMQPQTTTLLPGVYYLTLTIGVGCTTVLEVIVPECESPRYYIPNIFSPNGDQINDYFQIYANELQEADMYIYDRWGNIIFIKTEVSPIWDGRAGSLDAAPGVYTYVIEMRFLNGSIISEAGSLTLIR